MITLLLPPRARFGGQRLSVDTGRALARADRSERVGDALSNLLDVLPRGWPVAAASRQRDAGDAAGAAWLRADPAYVRPDINGARLLSYGEALGLNAQDAAALLKPLKPLFGDAGFPIDAPAPSRWYLRLPTGAKWPEFTAPEQALGADLFDELPQGPDGRRWRALLSEAQVVLHNHPLNAQRAAAGLAPVNSLWFWGAGTLPDRVQSAYTRIASDDESVTALAAIGGVDVAAKPASWNGRADAGNTLYDLRDARDLALLERGWFAPLLQAVGGGELKQLRVEFDDGARYDLARSQRWRFWRRPLASFIAATADTPGNAHE
ncbi:phosphoglycerate mutase [Lysobacter auxotrophicus]|uniref:Phosphoglycerate mutase n=1 Tax=Lysobacter auxotrophicus TaxID=2992573 RepID=A0ABN6UKK1_9GAMM|nr:phosphoglycerate mutase [Lysobacter auxotrophicus]BDU16854.1 phosphoglycerate mutase [Lysobacter auxotrophicus]